MVSFSNDWLNRYEAKRAPKEPPKPASPAVSRERDLHSQILYECIGRGWLAFHGSMAHRTWRTGGEPDFIILTGKCVLLVEAKAKAGKLSEDQQAVAAWAKRLGHTVHVVRSIEQFIQIADSI